MLGCLTTVGVLQLSVFALMTTVILASMARPLGPSATGEPGGKHAPLFEICQLIADPSTFMGAIFIMYTQLRGLWLPSWQLLGLESIHGLAILR